MKGLLLISGGFDSAVAGYVAKQHNIELSALHFSLEPFTDSKPFEKSKNCAKVLGLDTIYYSKAGDYFLQFAKHCNEKYYFILGKRFMLKAAEKLALKNNFDFLITGENLGQVSSQTSQSLAVIQKAINIPLIRPLLCYDKEEILTVAKKIGTYELSKGPECCDVLASGKPITSPDLSIVLEEEKKININSIVEKAFSEMQEIRIN